MEPRMSSSGRRRQLTVMVGSSRLPAGPEAEATPAVCTQDAATASSSRPSLLTVRSSERLSRARLALAVASSAVHGEARLARAPNAPNCRMSTHSRECSLRSTRDPGVSNVADQDTGDLAKRNLRIQISLRDAV